MNIFHQAIVKFVSILPKSVVYIFAKKYIAGTSLNDAVKVTQKLNSKGIFTTIDVLGESIQSKSEAEEAKNECLKVLDAIEENKLKSNLSIKITQLGLLIDENMCYDFVSEILERAKRYSNFVRMDMEDSSVTDKTINLFLKLKENYDNLGIVLQAYLRRTQDDIKRLNPHGTNYRLCKGIYIEPESIAYKNKAEIRKNYLESLKLILDNGNYVGIATHDNYLIEHAYKLIKEKNVPKNKFEFQMLYGVTEYLRDKINSDGYKIRIYIPFGKYWHPYSIRRLQENPQLAWYITKSIFSFKS